jgi:hypothetical protein
MEALMDVLERRKDRRLDLKVEVLCTEARGGKRRLCSGRAINISSGGLYFETEEGGFERGSMMDVSIEVPAQAGVLEFGGRIRTMGSVVRTEVLPKSCAGVGASRLYGVALQFCSTVHF